MNRMVSFVVPTFNSARTLDRCLRSILDQDLGDGGPQVEVIVVDNGSTDPSLEIAASHPVRVVTEAIPGAASARNRGISEAHGEWIALVDSDCEIPPEWTHKALLALESHERVCAAGGPGRLPPDRALSRCLNALHYGLAPMGPRRYVRSLATMNALYEGPVLRKFRFNPAYYWAEDAEMNLRLVEAGYRLLFDPSLAVIHHHPTTFAGILKKWYEYGIQYPGPYLREGRIFSDPGFLPRLLYIPVLILLIAAGFLSPWLWTAAAVWLLLLPAAYCAIGIRAVRGIDRLVFPILHTAKQWAQMIGMMIGFLAPSRRTRRRAGETKAS